MFKRDNLRVLRGVALTSLIVTGGVLLTGCNAARLMIKYGHLHTKTEFNESIFFELRTDLPPTVYVSETSTAGHDIQIASTLREHLSESGYTLASRPDEATYLLQINHLSLIEFELTGDQTLDEAINSASTVGGVAAAGAFVLGAKDGKTITGVGIAAGLVGFIADAATKHIAHTLTTDILITETAPSPEGELEYRYHRVQIISGASKVNLKLKESLPAMVQGVSNTLAGLLPMPHVAAGEG